MPIEEPPTISQWFKHLVNIWLRNFPKSSKFQTSLFFNINVCQSVFQAILISHAFLKSKNRYTTAKQKNITKWYLQINLGTTV